MSTNVSMAHLRAAHGKLKALKASVRNQAEAPIEAAITIGSVLGGSYGCGIAKGKFGVVQVAGVPADLLAGAAFAGLTALGAFGKHVNVGVGLAAGCIGAYGHTMGAAHGAKMSGSPLLAKLSAVSGIGALPDAAVPSTAELDQLIAAAQVRAA